MELYISAGLEEQVKRIWDPKDLAERLAPLDSPLRLGSLLTPLNGAVFRRREGKQRLVFVPHRRDDGTWRLVLVDVIDRRSGDQQGGRYRILLDDTARERRRYLDDLTDGQLQLVATDRDVRVEPLAPLPPDLWLWTQRQHELADRLQQLEHDDETVSFHHLDPSQQQLLDGVLRAEAPRFLTGRAGSSKSTLLHQQFARYADFAIEEDSAYTPRFATRSRHLLEDARERVTDILLREHGYGVLGPEALARVNGWMSTTADLLKDVVLDAQGAPEQWQADRHITTARFRNLYDGRKPSGNPLGRDEPLVFPDHRTRKCLHWTTAWFVIRALIRGYDPAGDLDPEAYEELPKRDRLLPVEVFQDVFTRVYHHWYLPLCEAHGFLDDQALARAAIQTPNNGLRIAALVCDEAQDLSRVELLALLSSSDLLRFDLESSPLTCLPFVFAGDESQTLELTGFRWASITSGFYELASAAFGTDGYQIDDDQLEINYRSSFEIVQVANAIQGLRRDRFGESEARIQKPRRSPMGTPIHLVDEDTADPEALRSALELNNVIVPCEDGEEHDYVLQHPGLRSAIERRAPDWVDRNDGPAPVYTAQALKGLELDSAVLYRWGDALLDNDSGPLLARRAEHARWYVAVTRARQQLTVIESSAGRLLWEKLELPDEILVEQELTAVDDEDARRLELAEAALARGHAARNPEELLRAASDLEKLGDDERAMRARAFAHRFDDDPTEAAALFLELGEYEQAANDLWDAQQWTGLAGLPISVEKVLIARLLTDADDAATVDEGAAALRRLHHELEGAGESLDLVDQLAEVAQTSLSAGWPTHGVLLDALALEPQLARRQRTGLAGLISKAIAVDLDLASVADSVAQIEATDIRDRLARWIAGQGSFTHEERVSFVGALLEADARTTATNLASHFGLGRTPPDETGAPEPDVLPSSEAGTLRPGDPWAGDRGRERWKLAKQGAKMTRRDDDTPLEAIVGAEQAVAFIEGARQVRPTGGAIWIDNDGVATTLVEGQLTYLGTLHRSGQPASAPPAATSAPPRRRQPPHPSELPEVDGWPPRSRRYTLHRHDISDPRTGQTLSSVIGADAAGQQAADLLTHRAKGGRIYVAPDGRAVSKIDDRYFVIGTVTSSRWFPGELGDR